MLLNSDERNILLSMLMKIQHNREFIIKHYEATMLKIEALEKKIATEIEQRS